MRKVRMGFIGTGGIAQAHLRAIHDEEGIEVVAVSDIVIEKAQQTAARWGIPHAYAEYQEMLAKEDIEAVTICTYNQAHRAPTVDALRAGKHVLVEKPMAATLDDATAMTAAAHETGKLLMVALKTRYSPDRIAAKRIVDAGTLGRVYYAEAVAARRCFVAGGSFVRKDMTGIGVVADIGVYALDDALWLMGHPTPVSVVGTINNLVGKKTPKGLGDWGCDPEELEVEDFGVGYVQFEDGAVLVLKTSWIMHMDTLGGTLFLGEKAGMRLNPLTIYRHEWGLLTDTIPQAVPFVDGDELFRLEHLAFADAIREGKPSPIPADEMLLTNVIIQGLVDSAAVGHQVAVSIPKV